MTQTYIKLSVSFQNAMEFFGENWHEKEMDGWNLEVKEIQPKGTTHPDFRSLEVKLVLSALPNQYLVMKTIHFIEDWFEEKDIFFPIQSVRFNGEFLPSYPE
jgi:hypothetical protein